MTAPPLIAAPSRTLRADRILAAAIAMVSLLIAALLIALASEDRLHANTVQTIVAARTARDEMQALTRSLADVELARRSIVAGERAGASYLLDATSEARAHVAKLEELGVGDGEFTMLASHIAALVERDFATPPTAPVETTLRLRSDLRTAMDFLRIEFNQRNDIARRREKAERERLALVAGGLAILSLVASGLAIFVLRRERAQWRLAHQAAEEAHAKAAASDLAKTRFLAVASHDMRQPLHALTLYLSALGKRVEGDEARAILTKAQRATQSMIAMFATLLDLARVQAGVIKPEISAFHLQDALDRVVGEHPGADIITATTNVTLQTDPVLLERLLRNLVSNALKHGGGSARIEAKVEANHAAIAVIDRGPGIAPHDQARVFDEFVRLEGANGGAEGLGLGLSIVRRVANLLDLAVELKSSPAEGAAFIVRVPLAPDDAPAPAAQTHAPGRLDADVLVLDDDPLALEAMAGALRDMGGRVSACANEGELDTALEGGAVPRLFITDLRIDGRVQGFDIAKRVQARFSPPPTIVIVTGDTAEETLSALRSSGHQWLIKPVDPAQLARIAADI